MHDDVKNQVKEMLNQDVVDLFLAYRMMDGHPLPFAFSRENIEEVEDLVTGPARYPLEKLALEILKIHPEATLGILARECDQRALNVLSTWNQLEAGRVKTIRLSCCPSNLKEHSDCSYLEPHVSGSCKTELGFEFGAKTEDLEALAPERRFSRWMYEFEKCIKCYGCRNICPVCFCRECSLEHPDLIGTGPLPPEVPLFHLVRAVHMAGRCIDCGLCEDACPAEIPLRLLYGKVNEIVKEVFGYETGTSPGQSPFQVLGTEMMPEPL
ncbi:MAG: 4Fe-4S binding protein [Deltaproteobacteria bacterium]|nr:4Fe-4S binding protein [Deltaproteobacteria bacterium]